MNLEPSLVLNGIFAIILVIIFFIVGIRIALVYRQSNEKTYIYFGLTWIGMVEAWIASTISFIVYLIDGKGLDLVTYIIISVGFYPITSFLWTMAYTELFYKKHQKLLVIIFLILGVIYEIILFSLLMIDPALVGELTTPVDAHYELLITLYIIFVLSGVLLVTGLIISIRSIKSGVPEHKFRGIFLIIAIILFILGAYLDSSVNLNILTLTITRIILISSAFVFYCAFVMPERLKFFLIKK